MSRTWARRLVSTYRLFLCLFIISVARISLILLSDGDMTESNSGIWAADDNLVGNFRLKRSSAGLKPVVLWGVVRYANKNFQPLVSHHVFRFSRFSRFRLFIFTILWWPSCANDRIWARNFSGKTIQVFLSTIWPHIENSDFTFRYWGTFHQLSLTKAGLTWSSSVSFDETNSTCRTTQLTQLVALVNNYLSHYLLH